MSDKLQIFKVKVEGCPGIDMAELHLQDQHSPGAWLIFTAKARHANACFNAVGTNYSSEANRIAN